MQNNERQKFEENWKSAFDGAEMTPPDRVWSSIELDLAGQESAVMKKRVVFYQRLAAATVLFALLSGVYAFYPRDNNEKQTAVVKKDAATEVRSQERGDRSEEGLRASDSERVVSMKEKVVNEVEVATIPEAPGIPVASNNEQQVAFAEATKPVVSSETIVGDPGNSTTTEQPVAEQKTEQAIVSPLLQTAPQVASLEPEETNERKEKRSHENNLWLALGAAAGNYTPNTPNSKAQTTSQASFAGLGPMNADAPSGNNTNTKSEPKVGASYSVGMAVGKKFGRVVIQTGVNLNRQQVEYTSNYDRRTPNNSAKASSMDYLDVNPEMTNGNYNSSNVMMLTNSYTVNSTMEIVSIPVQAGYMIIDRKLGWQVNAGVSSDIFLKNILEDKSGQREKFTQSAGSESPYRSLNWSGLMNTEISYRIGNHYRLSVVPGVRYSFNSILKDPTDNGKPVILDVGFRFKYLFE